MKRGRVALWLCLSCATRYDPCFPPGSAISDLRVLAVRLDPPEVLIDPQTLETDGRGVFIRALVADPAASSETVAVRARLCGTADDNGRCPPQTQWTASARGPADNLPPMVMVPSAQTNADARRGDPLNGFGGTRITIELEVRGPDGALVSASKLLVASERRAGYVPNRGLDVVTAVVRRQAGVEERYGDGGLVQISVGETVGVSPELAPDSIEEYDTVDLAGNVVHLRERVSYSFYVTPHAQYGDLGTPEVGADVADEPAPGEPRPERGLVLLSGTAASAGRGYVVARDGRGAEAWLRLDLAMVERRTCNIETKCRSYETTCK